MQRRITTKSSTSNSSTMGGIIVFLAICILGSTVLLLVARPALSSRIAGRIEGRWTEIARSDAGHRAVRLRDAANEQRPSTRDYRNASTRIRSFLLADEHTPLIIGGLGASVLALVIAGIVLGRLSQRSTRTASAPRLIVEEDEARRNHAGAEPAGAPQLLEGRRDDIPTKLARLRARNDTRLIFDEPVQIHISSAVPPPPDPAAKLYLEPEPDQSRQPTLRPIRARRTS